MSMTLSHLPRRIDLRLPLALASALFMTSGRATAQSVSECAEAYEKAQVVRKAGHLAEAIGNLARCTAESCPSFVRKDCFQWLTEVERARPSVVFSVRDNGRDLTDVAVSCDGQVLARSLDGKAVKIDPGAHLFTFHVAGGPELKKQVIVQEGQSNRIVEIEIGNDKATTADPQSPSARLDVAQPRLPREAAESKRSMSLAYGLTGAGVLAMSGFVALGAWGYSEKRDLQRRCSPFCQPSEVDQARTKYILADACLAAGALSLGLAAYMFLREPGAGAQTDRAAVSATILPSLSGSGGVVDITGSF